MGLAILCLALMQVYLLGDVLRVFCLRFSFWRNRGQINAANNWLGVAAMMLAPVVMMVLKAFSEDKAMFYANIDALFLFNAFELQATNRSMIYFSS